MDQRVHYRLTVDVTLAKPTRHDIALLHALVDRKLDADGQVIVGWSVVEIHNLIRQHEKADP